MSVIYYVNKIVAFLNNLIYRSPWYPVVVFNFLRKLFYANNTSTLSQSKLFFIVLKSTRKSQINTLYRYRICSFPPIPFSKLFGPEICIYRFAKSQSKYYLDSGVASSG